MASPYILTNVDLQYSNAARQDFRCYLAFLNPVSITTTWSDLTEDTQGNWNAPPNVDTCAQHIAPYAPMANLGSNRIGFVNEAIYFDGSRSCQRLDLPVTQYQWAASGPSQITTYANSSQCAISWSSTGLYTVSLTVTNSAGTRTTGTRQVMVYQDRSSALPGVISISGLSGTLSSGGWQCQLTTMNSQVSLFAPEALPVGTYQPLVLMIETSFEVAPHYWSNRTIGPHGHFTPGQPYQDPRIFFDGYVQSGTIHQDVDKDTLSFSCIGPQMILQESKTHMLGYYSASYASITNGIPQSLKTSTYGKGFLVNNLMTSDIVHSLLQYHCNIASYHDLHVWNPTIPTMPFQSGAKTAYSIMNYSGLSVNEGTMWSNIQDLCANEWSTIYCDHDGSIRIGPQINYRGNEYWSQPTLLGGTVAETLLNFYTDVGSTVTTSDLTQIGNTLPDLDAQPMPVKLVHPWGHSPGLPVVSAPFQYQLSEQVASKQKGLIGPPILCVFSDVPVIDDATVPPDNTSLFPWTQIAWPQDLAVYPISFDIPQSYTGRTSLVKIIGTLANANNIWSAWYPQSAFTVASNGTSTTIANKLPAGNWFLDQKYVLPDITTPQNKTLVSNYWWEMARRVYYAQNVSYQCTITLGMFTAASLGDIVAVTRQTNTLGPHWNKKPFYVQEISYSFDMQQKTWMTSISTVEVTSALLTPIQPPPKVIPKY